MREATGGSIRPNGELLRLYAQARECVARLMALTTRERLEHLKWRKDGAFAERSAEIGRPVD